MRQSHAAPRRLLPWVLLGVVVVLGVAGCHGPYPQSTLSPKGPFAETVDGLFMKTVWLAGVVFVLVEGALLWAIFKYRGKPNDAEPHQMHGSTVVEILWTVIPALVLAIVAVPTVKAIFSTAKVPTTSPDGQPPLKIEVVGHQWWWEFRYPELGITTAGELHVPVNRAIDLRLKTADVLHAFWVPAFSGKRDIFPNRETRLWFIADSTGMFPSACTEFCGLQHARMDFQLSVDSPDNYKAWVANRLADSAIAMNGTPAKAVAAAGDTGKKAAVPVVVAGMDPVTAAGTDMFLKKGCSGCHSISAMKTQAGMLGPNLSGIGTRKMIASGWLENTDENLKRWIQHTNEVKEGTFMKPPPVSDAEVATLIAYLRTRH